MEPEATTQHRAQSVHVKVLTSHNPTSVPGLACYGKAYLARAYLSMLPKPQGLETWELFFRLSCQHGSSLDATHRRHGRESRDSFFWLQVSW